MSGIGEIFSDQIWTIYFSILDLKIRDRHRLNIGMTFPVLTHFRSKSGYKLRTYGETSKPSRVIFGTGINYFPVLTQEIRIPIDLTQE